MPNSTASKVPIGGWLILPAIGTHLAPLYALYSIGQDADVLKAARASVSPEIIALVWLEITGLALLIAGWCIAIYFLHNRNRKYPDLFSWLLLAMFAFTGLEVVAFYGISGQIDRELSVTFGRSIIAVLIWVPYMFLSRRVDHTFRGGPWHFPVANQFVPILKIRPSYRAKAHRIGLFLTAFSLLPILIGLLTQGSAETFSIICLAVGGIGLVFGYATVRLWFWANNPPQK